MAAHLCLLRCRISNRLKKLCTSGWAGNISALAAEDYARLLPDLELIAVP